MYGVSIVGEGGEFETLVVDAPIYKKRIVMYFSFVFFLFLLFFFLLI